MQYFYRRIRIQEAQKHTDPDPQHWSLPLISSMIYVYWIVLMPGLESGDILLHNLKYDETVVKFHQDWGSVTALTFRTDGKLGTC